MNLSTSNFFTIFFAESSVTAPLYFFFYIFSSELSLSPLKNFCFLNLYQIHIHPLVTRVCLFSDQTSHQGIRGHSPPLNHTAAFCCLSVSVQPTLVSVSSLQFNQAGTEEPGITSNQKIFVLSMSASVMLPNHLLLLFAFTKQSRVCVCVSECRNCISFQNDSRSAGQFHLA